MSTPGRRFPDGVGRGAAETSGSTERFDGFTPEQWKVVRLAWEAGYEAGDADGFARCDRLGETRFLDGWVRTFRTDPATPFRQTREHHKVTYRTEPRTAAQILAQARWSWDRVERQIRDVKVGDVA